MDRQPLRLWPGVAGATLIVAGRYLLPLVAPQAAAYGLLASFAGAAVVVMWWVFFSRAPWVDRLVPIAIGAAVCLATGRFVDASIGAMRPVLLMYLLPPLLGPLFVAWAAATRRSSDTVRRGSMTAIVVLTCSAWLLFRVEGAKASVELQLTPRWKPTAEQRLLAEGNDAASVTPPAAPVAAPPALPDASKETVRGAAPTPPPIVPRKPAEWPGFRGPNRDGVVHDVRIATDWTASPPVQIWKRAVGPAWSSFAVDGDLLYTQEQRGEDEVVACYRVSTGQPVWRHRDRARFYEVAGGAGPRATPAVVNGRVYAMGATGIVNALDAATGAPIWTRNAAVDTGKEIPDWGLASSPLVVDDLVVTAAAGRLVAYDAATGARRWLGPDGGGGYSSPQLMTIAGVPQIVLLRGSHTIGVAPKDGAVLWEHEWQPAMSVVQPATTGDGDLLIASGDIMGGNGVERVSVNRGPAGWTVQQRWTSRGLKPFFNDYVVHKGHAYGFDGAILACVDLADGSRQWKGGRYGNGQLLVLADEDLLLVLSEEGDLALVKATPDRFTEVATFAGALDGKTWNHPVVVRDLLLVRNDREMAAFRLPRAAPTAR